MDTPHLDRFVEEGTHIHERPRTGPIVCALSGKFLHRLLSATTGIYRNRDARASIVGRETLCWLTVNVGIAHTSAYKTPMGFDERYVVENKDRYLADVPNDTPFPSERYYPGECAKALCAREVL